MKEKQLNFFAYQDDVQVVCRRSTKQHHGSVWKLHIDGASRNNPGKAGAGFSLQKNNKSVCQQGFFLGTWTNNQAEYLALLLGVFFAQEFIDEQDELHVFSDSQLLVRQMNREYKVKDQYLKKLQSIAFDLLKGYNYSFEHVYREDNVQADALANRGIDKQVKLPKKFVDLLESYEIL